MSYPCARSSSSPKVGCPIGELQLNQLTHNHKLSDGKFMRSAMPKWQWVSKIKSSDKVKCAVLFTMSRYVINSMTPFGTRET